jgi:hypothetical protein
MATVAEYIAKNNKTVLELRKMALLPLSVMQNYEIYQMVLAIKDEPKRMKVYQRVANHCKCSVETVRKAVREMQKPI